MADAFTQVSSVTTVQTGYDQLAYFALRPMLHFDQAFEVKPSKQDKPGSTVKFTFWADMAAAITALSETVDVDAVALSDSQVTVTLVEQGNAVLTTAKLRGTSFLNVDADAANIVGYNAGLTQDTLARDVLVAGTNVRFAGAATSRVTVAAAHTLAAANIRRARAELVGASVMPWPDNYYRAHIHPDVALDLRAETGAASWRDPHTYSQPAEIWAGEIGAFEGFRFIETERGAIFVNAGVGSTVDVYATTCIGRQAGAKAFSSSVSAPTAQVVVGTVTDKLRRFQPIGWYWLGGYGRFREAAIRRIESSSSIGAN